MKKKSYMDPVMELVSFAGEDIICASGDNDTDASKLWDTNTQNVSDYENPVE